MDTESRINDLKKSLALLKWDLPSLKNERTKERMQEKIRQLEDEIKRLQASVEV